MNSSFTSKVVGLTFRPGYPNNLIDLEFIVFNSDEVDVELVRNPDNSYDANAIEVHVPALNGDRFVGHIPAPLAAKLAPLMDAGEEWSASVEGVQVDPAHPDNPGLTILVRRA